MIYPAALIAAPLAVVISPLPPVRRMDPADLWTADPGSLTPSELSSLLEETTGWTLEAITDDDGPGYYMRDPYGDREGDGFPWRDLAEVIAFVAPEIDLALA